METLPKLATLKRADRRRFIHFCTTNRVNREWLAQVEAGEYRVIGQRNWPNPLWLGSYKWVLATDTRLGISDEEMNGVRKRIPGLNTYHFFNYNAKPIQPKQDNKSQRASSRGCSGNTIRFPRKARSKACWRRFYKLFPHLQPVAASL